MQGLTEVLFRRCYEHCFPNAVERAVSPFLSLTHGRLSNAWDKIEDVLPERNTGSIPVVPQILGREPDLFLQLACRLGEMGYSEVNWNIGCPMRRVAGKRRGSGILPYPDLVRGLLETIVPRLDGMSLSVKMRLGYGQPDEIFALIPILNDYPLASVTIHPRTGRQQYGGQCDLERFGRAAALLRHPVVYNGDIRTVADYRDIWRRFPTIADIMIGRGILYDPLLPLRLHGETPEPGRSILFLRTLLDDILTALPTDQARVRKIKEYWCLMWHITGVSESAARAVLRTSSLDATLSAIEQILLSLHTEAS
ncbi:MAG: hypothetical protein AUK63_1111 [bacterium P3]|nr:MAG: hypothetical protein AUK63_1111 [bacterium P3]KWW40665.1 MAG: hypothetical protein F083_1459 [bacterium F083]